MFIPTFDEVLIHLQYFQK